MAARKQKSTKHSRINALRIHPAVLLVLLAAGLLGLVVKLNLSRVNGTSSSDPLPLSNRVDDRWVSVMKDLIGQTRHFKGTPDAPVTILEFSDFQ